MEMVQTVTDLVRQKLADQGAGHGMDHVLRVWEMARSIQAQTGGDRLIIELAALLHDIGDAKFHEGEERSGEFSREILSKLAVRSDVIEHVVEIVDKISFRKGIDASELSLEGKVVQDADRLDALGAIGIVRTIEYGAVKGQPFYCDDGSEVKTGIAHFDEKLFKLRGLMNTQAGRRLAKEREDFMRKFIDQFYLECETPSGAS